MATSLAVPVAYISVLVTALAIFSRVYRRRKLALKNIIAHNMVKSALLLRAIEDVKRIWRIRDDKAALTSLHTRGLLGDDTKARFEYAEKELEAEILDVVQEANSFKQGWGGLIFATATEMAQAERTRETVLSIPKIRQREEKRLALRRRYLPESDPSITPAPAAAQIASASASASASTSASGTSTPAKEAIAAPAPPTPAQVTAIEKEGSTTPSPQAAAAGSGSNSGASTPSKNTPSKKKKGKK